MARACGDDDDDDNNNNNNNSDHNDDDYDDDDDDDDNNDKIPIHLIQLLFERYFHIPTLQWSVYLPAFIFIAIGVY